MFNGNPVEVNFKTYSGSKLTSFIALANGSTGMLVGTSVQRKYDFARSKSLGGFYFSSPYYYANEAVRWVLGWWNYDSIQILILLISISISFSDANFYTIATPKMMWCSLHLSIALYFLQSMLKTNSLDKVKSGDMPLVTEFGTDLTWALRDAILFRGSYDEMYSENVGSNINESTKGRNTLNEGGPLLHSLSLPW